MHQAEEDLIVLAAQSGNQKAFYYIYQKYYKSLLRYAFKICNDKDLAQDAAQEVWIKFAKGIRKLNDPRALRSWLYRLVRWRTIDLMRISDRYESNEYLLDNEKISQSNEESTYSSDDLMLVINRLPSIEKQMIHLFYLDELKVSEIASVLDIPNGTVKSRLNRARKLLRQKFDHI